MSTTPQATPTPPRPRAPRALRLVVWALLALIVFAGMAGMSAVNDAAPHTAAQPVAAETVGSAHRHTRSLLHGDVSKHTPAGAPSGEGLHAAGSNAVLPKGTDTTVDYEDHPLSLVPAYRWNEQLSFMSNLGVADVSPSGINLIADFIFAGSRFIWMLTLGLISFASSVDFLQYTGGVINKLIHSMISNLWPILGMLYAFILMKLSKELMKGNFAAFTRGVAAFILPISLVFTMGSATGDPAAQGAGGAHGAQAHEAVGTPVWMASTVVENVKKVGEGLATAFDPMVAESGLPGASGGDGFVCGNYVKVLEDSYKHYGAKKRYGGTPVLVSKLWMLSLYDPWSRSALGDTPMRHSGDCQFAERMAGIHPHERQALAKLAWGEDVHVETVSRPDRTFGEGNWSMDTWETSLWMACTPDDKMKQVWVNTMHEIHDDNWPGDLDSPDAMCVEWRTEGREDLNSDLEALFGDRDDIPEVEVRAWFDAATGHNSMSRLVNSFTALIGAVTYLFSFAGLAVGVILGKIGLVIGVLLLPFTMTLIAMQVKAGGKLLRWTLSMCALDLVFTVLLGVLFQITLIGVSAINMLGADAASADDMFVTAFIGGAFKNLLIAFVPVIAIVLLSKVTKAAGIGSMANPLSAAGMLNRASAKALGTQSGGDFARDAMRKSYDQKKSQLNTARGLKEKFTNFKNMGSGLRDARKKASMAARAAHEAAGGDEARNRDPEKYKDDVKEFLESPSGRGATKALAELEEAEATAAARQQMLLSGQPLALWKDMQGAGNQDILNAVRDAARLDDGQDASIGSGRDPGEEWRDRAFASDEQEEALARSRYSGPKSSGGLEEARTAQGALAGMSAGSSGIYEDPTMRSVARAAVVQDTVAEFAAATGVRGQVTPAAMRGIADAALASNLKGLSIDQVLVSSSGIAIPNPELGPLSVPASLATHPALHLPPEHRARQPGESDAAYADRAVTVLAASGAMRVEQGQPVWGMVWGNDPSFPAPQSSAEVAGLRELTVKLSSEDRALIVGQVQMNKSAEGEAMLAAALAAVRNSVDAGATQQAASLERLASTIADASKMNTQHAQATLSQAAYVASSRDANDAARVAVGVATEASVSNALNSLAAEIAHIRGSGGSVSFDQIGARVHDVVSEALRHQPTDVSLAADDPRIERIVAALDTGSAQFQDAVKSISSAARDGVSAMSSLEAKAVALSALVANIDSFSNAISEVRLADFVGSNASESEVQHAVDSAVADNLARPLEEIRVAIDGQDEAKAAALMGELVDRLNNIFAQHDEAMERNTAALHAAAETMSASAARDSGSWKRSRIRDTRIFPD